MTRLIAALVALLLYLPPVAASLDRQKPLDRSGVIPLPFPKNFCLDTTEVPPPAEAQLTAETEVFVDGRKCQCKDVPATASVTRMVLAPDGKTITRVKFRTRPC